MTTSLILSKEKKEEDMLRSCLRQIRNEKIKTSTILRNGECASKFSFEYIVNSVKNNEKRRFKSSKKNDVKKNGKTFNII
jgi:hypothetical protein